MYIYISIFNSKNKNNYVKSFMYFFDNLNIYQLLLINDFQQLNLTIIRIDLFLTFLTLSERSLMKVHSSAYTVK